MILSIPKGASPVGVGVVTQSQAIGKVVSCEAEVSQTAVCVLTYRNYILRLLGGMR